MKFTLIILSLILIIMLTGCTIKLPFLENNSKKKSGDTNIEQPITQVNNNTDSAQDYFDETFVIAIDNTTGMSEYEFDEINSAFIDFDSDGSFYAYLGFGNMTFGTYTSLNGIITCNIKTFSTEYSPVQDVSASMTFKKDYAILTVLSASPSFTVKTTYMNDAGDWVFDGGTKDIPLSAFERNYTYTLYMPIEY